MKCDTTRFGRIEINEQDIVLFKDGLPGFEGMRRFVLISLEDESPFFCLQSVDNGELGFILVDPFAFYQAYDFQIPQHCVEELGIKSQEQVIVRSIVTIRDTLESATLNLVAPLIFNIDERKAMQIILTNTEYSTRHPLIPQAAG